MKKLLLPIFALAILLGIPSFAFAAEGDLVWSKEISNGYEMNDPKFDSMQGIGPGAYSMAIGTDGFVYAAAAPFYYSSTAGPHYRVAKFDATGSEKFNKTFTDGNFLYISDVEVDDSGWYLLGGSYIPGDPYGDVQWDIMKLSKDNATILWRKQYNPAVGKATGGVRIDYAQGLYSDGSDLYVLGDYNLYGFDWTYACGLMPCSFTGSEGVGVYKLNKSTGNNDSWPYKWSGGSASFTNMTHVSDIISDGTSLYINGADMYGSYSFFQKIDKNGNLIWRKTNSSSASADYSSAHRLIEYDSQTNAFYRVYWDGSSKKNVLQKLDTSGNVVYTKNFDHNDSHYDPPVGIGISGDHLILASLNMLGKYDKNGTKIWSQQKGDWRSSYSYQGAMGVGSDGIYVSHVNMNWNTYTASSTIKKYSLSPIILNCGTVTDTRDTPATVYDTVQIGTQCWMRENMNVGQQINTPAVPSDPTKIEKYCYNNDSNNCTSPHPTYADGGLYTWDEAMQGTTVEGAQGICPTGWHIPTDAEWFTLENYLKGDSNTCDKDRTAWFDCAPAGTRLRSGGSSGFEGNLSGWWRPLILFQGIGSGGYFWSSSESGANALLRFLISTTDTTWRGTDSKLNA